MKSIFSIEKLGEQWSDQALKEKIFKLLIQLAEIKRDVNIPNYEQITLDWIKEIDIEFEEQECYVSVIGLTLLEPLQLGDVKFIPLKDRSFSFNKIFTSHIDQLIPERDCLAITHVTAEWQKSAEVAREKVEKALNILRFIGALIWWDRPIGHIYVAGKELERVSYTLIVEAKTGQITGRMGHTESTPAPFKVDKEFLEFAEFYGLSHIQSLISQKVSPIEDDLMAAIQWFGYASQELTPLVSFVKFYIAIETAVKKDGEKARTVLPKRIAVLLEPWSKVRQDELEKELSDIIGERNAVFHEGKVEKYSPSYLADTGRILARGVINQLRLKIASESWKTKDELITWAHTQTKRLSE